MINFIETFDDALTTKDCDYIINWMNQDGICLPNKKEHKGEILKDYSGIAIDALDLTSNKFPKHIAKSQENDCLNVNSIITSNLIQCIHKYVSIHPQLKLINPWNYTPIYNLQKYIPNQGYYANHCENGCRYTSDRILVWMFYLNDVEDGGTYFDNYDYTMDAVKGRCVIWPSYWTHHHRGIVSKTKTKYIATGWVQFIKYM